MSNPSAPATAPTAPTAPTPSLEMALSIAREAHQGQKRRHGAPYIGHPVAVHHLVEDLAFAAGIAIDDVTRAVTLLHDVLEDSDIGADELRARFGDDVADRVGLLTKHGKGPEATAAYYSRLRAHGDDALRLVKVSDRVHNLSELHLDPNIDKLHSYVGETLEHLVPMAREARAGAALAEALLDGIRAACRAQRQPIPAAAAPASSSPASSMPLGVYAILQPTGPANAPHATQMAELLKRVDELIAGGVVMMQLRAKERTDRDILAFLEGILPRCRAAGVPLVVNDRPDLAVAAGIDGVHVGQTDIPPLHARAIVGKTALVGASSHTEAELVAACAEGGADHVAVGPIYPSPTKVGHAAVVGQSALRERCHLARFPVVAIGGVVSPQRVAECAGAGAALVAAVSALEGADARVIARRMSASFFAARAARSTSAP